MVWSMEQYCCTRLRRTCRDLHNLCVGYSCTWLRGGYNWTRRDERPDETQSCVQPEHNVVTGLRTQFIHSGRTRLCVCNPQENTTCRSILEHFFPSRNEQSASAERRVYGKIKAIYPRDLIPRIYLPKATTCCGVCPLLF